MSSSFRALPGLFLRLSPSMESMAKLASVKTPSIGGDLTSETAVQVPHFSSQSLVKPPALRVIAVAEDVDSPKRSAIAIRLSCMRSDLPDLSAGVDENPDQSAPVYSVHSPRSLMLGTVSVLPYHNRGRTILVPYPSHSRVSPSLLLLPSSILGRRLYCTGQPKDGYARGWDWDSLNAKFEQQGEWYKDFLRKEAGKQAIRDEEYLKFCREGKQLEYVKKGIEELSINMKTGFMKMQEKFFNTDKHLDKKVREAFELTSSDILALVIWLEMLAWDVEKLSAAARRKEAQLEDKEYFQRQMKKAFDKLPKPFIKAINRLRSFIPSASRWYPARKWYPVALGIYVMYHDGITPADLYDAFLQWHAESLKKLREKLKKSKSEDLETQPKACEELKASAEILPKASAEEPPKASEEEPKASAETLPKASAEEPPKASEEEPPKKS